MIIAACAFIGILDSSYLLAERLLGGTVKCLIVKGCDTVTASLYSAILGIPVSLLGFIFYLTMFFLALAAYERGGQIIYRIIFAFSLAGVAASGWFLYVQAFVLEAYCTYCLISALISLIIFASAGWLIVKL